MDTLNFYREKIKEALLSYGLPRVPHPGIETEVILDTQNDHYEIITVGWRNEQRIHGAILHLDIRGGKIWIQHDGTEDGIASRLVAAGVPKSDIVLGFHSPFKRQFTEFAVE
jgi:ketopantoate reductase